MTSSGTASRRLPHPALLLAYRLLLWGGYLVLSLFIFAMWAFDTQNNTNLNDYDKANVPAMVYGTAIKPYVFRTLIPSAVRLLVGLVPDSLYEAARAAFLEQDLIVSFMAYRMWDSFFVVEYALVLLLILLTVPGFVWSIRELFRHLYSAPRLITDLVPVAALLVLPIYFIWGTHFIYDLPALFFFTLCLLLMLQERWRLFYLAFVLALLNKETAVLLIGVFTLYYLPRMGRRVLLRHLLLQIALFLIVKLSLGVIFRDNYGFLFEIHLLTNIRDALIPYEFPELAGSLVFFILIFRKFSEKPRFLRYGALILFPLFASYLIMGRYREIRVFYEAFPILFLLGFQTLCELLDWPLQPRKQSA